jgi:hypothetical protein
MEVSSTDLVSVSEAEQTTSRKGVEETIPIARHLFWVKEGIVVPQATRTKVVPICHTDDSKRTNTPCKQADDAAVFPAVPPALPLRPLFENFS